MNMIIKIFKNHNNQNQIKIAIKFMKKNSKECKINLFLKEQL